MMNRKLAFSVAMIGSVLLAGVFASPASAGHRHRHHDRHHDHHYDRHHDHHQDHHCR